MLQAALRRVRGDARVRLGMRELGLDIEVGRALARLADACFGIAHARDASHVYGSIVVAVMLVIPAVR